MAYKVIILYQLYMPSYFLGTFTEYPCINNERCFCLYFCKSTGLEITRQYLFLGILSYIVHLFTTGTLQTS